MREAGGQRKDSRMVLYRALSIYAKTLRNSGESSYRLLLQTTAAMGTYFRIRVRVSQHYTKTGNDVNLLLSIAAPVREHPSHTSMAAGRSNAVETRHLSTSPQPGQMLAFVQQRTDWDVLRLDFKAGNGSRRLRD